MTKIGPLKRFLNGLNMKLRQRNHHLLLQSVVAKKVKKKVKKEELVGITEEVAPKDDINVLAQSEDAITDIFMFCFVLRKDQCLVWFDFKF